MNQLPPAGWHPDPENQGQMRYWDGAAWTEHRHPRTDPTVGTPTFAAGSTATTGAERPWYKKKRFIIPAGVVGLAMLGNALPDGDKAVPVASQPITTVTVPAAPSGAASTTSAPLAKASPSKAAPAPKPAPKPAPVEQTEFGPQPAEQRKVMAAVATGQKALKSADNELRQGAALRARSKSMCAILNGRTVNGWTGKVAELGANGDGKGVLRIDVADDVEMKTWNNDLSDFMDETLIQPDSALYDKMLKLDEGQLVRFSGKFLAGDEGECVKEGSLSLTGKLGTPDFIFKFSDVKAL